MVYNTNRNSFLSSGASLNGRRRVCVRSLFTNRLFLSEMTYRHHLTVNGQFVALDIMDTAGEVSANKKLK